MTRVYTAPGHRLLRPEAIVFDWDNTLIDSWAAIHDAQNHVFAHFDMPLWTLEETRQRVRGSMRDAYPALFGGRWREAGEVFYARFAERHLDTLTPLDGVEAALQELKAMGLYLSIVSNKKGDYLRQEVAALGWESYFGRVIGAFDAARDKPAVDPVDLALSESGIARGPGVWFAGDADIDLACAQAADCIPVLVRPEAPGENEFDLHPPTIYVASCDALSLLVKTL